MVSNAAEGLRTSLMSGGARQSPLLGPAAVAIHNDGDMLGDILLLRFRKCHAKHLFLHNSE